MIAVIKTLSVVDGYAGEQQKKKDGLHSLEHHRQQQLTPITCVMNYKKRQIQFQKKNAVEPSQKNVNTTETTRAGGSIGPC